jgi:hypothetical protein
MFYYKTTINNKIYYFTNLNFCYYDEKFGNLIYCGINKAQYVLINDTPYRISWLMPENPKKENSYPTISVFELTKEEYEEGISEQQKETSEN